MRSGWTVKRRHASSSDPGIHDQDSLKSCSSMVRSGEGSRKERREEVKKEAKERKGNLCEVSIR
jgi:hypothetical protein